MQLAPNVTLQFDYTDRAYKLIVKLSAKHTTCYHLESKEEVIETLTNLGIAHNEADIPSL